MKGHQTTRTQDEQSVSAQVPAVVTVFVTPAVTPVACTRALDRTEHVASLTATTATHTASTKAVFIVRGRRISDNVYLNTPLHFGRCDVGRCDASHAVILTASPSPRIAPTTKYGVKAPFPSALHTGFMPPSRFG